MADTLLISQKYLQSKSIINDNADWEMIKPVLEVVQEIDLQKIIGTDLYKKLLLVVFNSYPPTNTPIPTDYKYLIDEYVIKYLHWMVVSKAGNVFKFRYMNKGVMEKDSDNSKPISTQDLQMISTEWSNYAESYGQTMVKYIEANLSKYPEYSSNNTLDKDSPSGNAVRFPFCTPESSNNNWWDK